ncbi:MAG: UDP-glucose dehydrogenase family protein [Planctomycetota bacterium]|jgi:UDPglucose 6-dehydrogenase
MKVCVVGVGYVGLVAAACLADAGNYVICVDCDKNKISSLKKGIIPIYEPGLGEIVKSNVSAKRLIFTTELTEGVDSCLIIFLAVGTPSAPDGSADISALLNVTESIAELMNEHPFDYVSNPEFLKEGAAVEDFVKPDRVIIGTTNPAVKEFMKQLYSPFMRKRSRIIFMDPASAELTKYAANCMLATRISFMNELSSLCEKVGADIELIRAGIGSDSRIGSAFLFPGVGYGGSCFPKDVQALIHTGKEQKSPVTIVEAVQEANIRQQDRFTQKILDYFRDERSITLAVWGLAFKAKTDDIRESPAIRCIEKFLEAGMKVKAYDPEAGEAAEKKLGGRIKTLKNSYEILDNADGLIIFTDWQEFRNPDFELIAKKLKRPLIFDGRNLYETAYVEKQGIEYHSIGRT